LLHLDGQVHHDTHAVPMGNYVIGVGNYVIATPSQVGNYKIADKHREHQPATNPRPTAHEHFPTLLAHLTPPPDSSGQINPFGMPPPVDAGRLNTDHNGGYLKSIWRKPWS
jgi:hypothetical protein